MQKYKEIGFNLSPDSSLHQILEVHNDTIRICLEALKDHQQRIDKLELEIYKLKLPKRLPDAEL